MKTESLLERIKQNLPWLSHPGSYFEANNCAWTNSTRVIILVPTNAYCNIPDDRQYSSGGCTGRFSVSGGGAVKIGERHARDSRGRPVRMIFSLQWTWSLR
jgi:hypothetical protein